MIVVDTNVVAYLLIDGDATAAAEKVRAADSDWALPALWRSEFRNVLALYVRTDQLKLHDAVAVMSAAEKLFTGGEYPVESQGVLELATSSGCSAYDAEFAWLADRLGVPLVTADKKLLRAFPGLAVNVEDYA
ncbi:MAG: type II toxin-antitoxin system VapC family toxin [Blastocatellia bacterium]|nr:type II toxin-antitoxin system VapC family toxin [Blastocatellia bacterium]